MQIDPAYWTQCCGAGAIDLKATTGSEPTFLSLFRWWFRSHFQTAADPWCPYLGLHFCRFLRRQLTMGVHTSGYIFGLFFRQRLTPGVHTLGYIFVSFSDSNGCRVSIPWATSLVSFSDSDWRGVSIPRATFLCLFQTATDVGCPYLGLHFCLFFRQRLTPGVHTSGSLTITQNGPHQFQ